MGWGDELMAAGQARASFERDGRRVRILDMRGTPRFHEAWIGNPHIARPEERGNFAQVQNGPSARPYIALKERDRWTWKNFRCTPAAMVFLENELAAARDCDLRDFVVVEPNLKRKASPNKDWGWHRWLAFAELAAAAGIRLAQLGLPGIRLLPGARHVVTTSPRIACAVLRTARAYVGHEGGMHHSAAAVGIPAVVLFGGFISPAQTGYAGLPVAARHRNLFTGGSPCGMRYPCPHCEKAMAAIEPRRVFNELENILVSVSGHLAA